MNNSENIGKLMYLELTKIESAESCSESEFIIAGAAEAILQSGDRNWIPIIVKETGDYQYEVVSNNFVYAVAKQAKLERAWCIVIDPQPSNIQQAKILTREVIPTVNLSTASKDTIVAVLKYLVQEHNWKNVKPVEAANKIVASNREQWSDFIPLTKLQCGLTKARLDCITKVFTISPPPPPPPPPEAVSVKRASRDEIFDRLNYLSTNKIGGFDNIDAEETADAIFNANKGKWKSLTPISKLECGIDTAKMKSFKTLFRL
ncbi:MAG: hypothetical protein HC849_25075 [Oscillatoriales cyanobacterium RU_3_3]|nr:hypothetical protein [Microcoleus sp. SU_5_3]NJM62726.1 hypothetical protein [Oscillatoriales cyanobacterium RU_3_3]NJR26230.1 hypothetical protein [Richelia sp. CSU_2_1]